MTDIDTAAIRDFLGTSDHITFTREMVLAVCDALDAARAERAEALELAAEAIPYAGDYFDEKWQLTARLRALTDGGQADGVQQQRAERAEANEEAFRIQYNAQFERAVTAEAELNFIRCDNEGWVNRAEAAEARIAVESAAHAKTTAALFDLVERHDQADVDLRAAVANAKEWSDIAGQHIARAEAAEAQCVLNSGEYAALERICGEFQDASREKSARIAAALAWHGPDDSGLCVCGDGVSPCRTARALTGDTT